MRILQLIDTLNPGGSERMSVSVSNALADEGHSVVLCASRQGGMLERALDARVSLEVLNKNSVMDLRAFMKLRRVVKQRKIEVVHAHSTSLGWAVALKWSAPQIRVIWHDHYGLSDVLKDSERREVRLLSRWLDATIVVNDRLLEWNLRNTRMSDQQVTYIPNFPYSTGARTERRERLGARLTVVCLANFREQKDHYTLLRALRTGIDVYGWGAIELILAGHVTDNGYLGRVKALIGELDLARFVTIAGPVEDIEGLLERADLGVLSSVSEGLPVSLLEYGVAGLPVVATRVGQIPEVIDHGSCGWLAPSGDAAAFAAAMDEAIRDEQLAIEKAACLRDRIAQKYGAGRFLDAYYQVLRNCGITSIREVEQAATHQ